MFSLFYKRLFCAVVMLAVVHNGTIQTKEVETAYNREKLGEILKSFMGIFAGFVGLTMVTRGIFLALNVPYPYALNHTVLISVNKVSDPEELKQEESKNLKKGLTLSAIGLLMMAGGWYALSNVVNQTVAA